MEVRNRRRWRKLACLSQMELATEANVGQSTVSNWEKGFPINAEVEQRLNQIVTQKARKAASQFVEQIGA